MKISNFEKDVKYTKPNLPHKWVMYSSEKSMWISDHSESLIHLDVLVRLFDDDWEEYQEPKKPLLDYICMDKCKCCGQDIDEYISFQAIAQLPNGSTQKISFRKSEVFGNKGIDFRFYYE